MPGPKPATPTPWDLRDHSSDAHPTVHIARLNASLSGQGDDAVCFRYAPSRRTVDDFAAIVHRVNNWDALVEAASTLATEAVLLLNSAEGCALSHYGHDAGQFGMPQWLADSRAKIETARAALSQGERS